MADNAAIVRQLLRAIEDGDLPRLRALYADTAIQVEMPNALKPRGDRRDVAQLVADLERGKGLLTSQAYEERNVVEDGGLVMMELAWRGVLAVPLGRLAAGDAMTCRSVLCFEVLDGRIASQRNYDCFDPF